MAATPFYFGDSDRSLYGVYHHAERRVARAPAVLLFNPFGEEALRAFRMYQQLAARLAAGGAAVMRFDYFATGDSAGDCDALTVDGMVRDSLDAAAELDAMSGLKRFVFIGAGFGAAIALKTARAATFPVDQIFLWDGALNGAEYLRDLGRAHGDFLAHALDRPALRRRADEPVLDEALGFYLSPALQKSIDAVTPPASLRNVRELHYLCSGATQPRKAKPVRIEGPQAAHFATGDAAWNSDAAMNEYTVPVAAIDYVATAAGLAQ